MHGNFGEIPPGQLVKKEHADDGKKESKKPEEAACVPEAPIEMPECGQ
jgi:hypothetical protein